jgi:hypothetical protein
MRLSRESLLTTAKAVGKDQLQAGEHSMLLGHGHTPAFTRRIGLTTPKLPQQMGAFPERAKNILQSVITMMMTMMMTTPPPPPPPTAQQHVSLVLSRD